MSDRYRMIQILNSDLLDNTLMNLEPTDTVVSHSVDPDGIHYILIEKSNRLD